jgi:hypothetical protein
MYHVSMLANQSNVATGFMISGQPMHEKSPIITT